MPDAGAASSRTRASAPVVPSSDQHAPAPMAEPEARSRVVTSRTFFCPSSHTFDVACDTLACTNARIFFLPYLGACCAYSPVPCFDSILFLDTYLVPVPSVRLPWTVNQTLFLVLLMAPKFIDFLFFICDRVSATFTRTLFRSVRTIRDDADIVDRISTIRARVIGSCDPISDSVTDGQAVLHAARVVPRIFIVNT